jgi:phosphatidyl-myo-inositol dimannoside synthase
MRWMKHSMNKAFILSSEFPPGPGGIGMHAYQMADHLCKENWQVKVLTQQDYVSPEEIDAFNKKLPFCVSTLARKGHWIRTAKTRWQQYRGVLKEWQPDLLVTTGDQMVALSAASQYWNGLSNGNGHKLRWCAVWHGFIPSRIINRTISQWSFGQPDLVIAVSNYSGQQLLEMGAAPHQMKVVLNGADEKRYFPNSDVGEQFKQQLGLNGAFILLTVGHVSERKGQDIVIQAMPEILERYPNVHYLIAGLPTLQPELERLAEKLAVRTQVHFLGKVEDTALNAVYNASDIFALTSRHSQAGQFEGYGIVVVEAALCAKPAVVAGNSGLAEAVQDGITGLVVPENDPHATAQAILQLLGNSELRMRAGERARQRAISEQTWDICMQQYDALFCSLVAGSMDTQL